MQVAFLACLAVLVLAPAVRAQGCKPGTIANADGKGGTQKKLGKASSIEDCAAIVLRQEPDANGATWKQSGTKRTKGNCYAEKRQSTAKSSSKYQNCYLQKTGEPCKSSVDKLTLHTGSKRSYQYLDARGFCAVDDSKSLVFWVKAGHDAFVTLSNDKAATNVIEVAIGTWLDTSSAIRERQKGSNAVKKGGGHLDKKFWRPFWVTWKNFDVTVGEGTNIGANSWMSAHIQQDVFYIGVTTGSGAEGDWAFGYDPTANTATPAVDPAPTPAPTPVPEPIEIEPCMQNSYPGQQTWGAETCFGNADTDIEDCKDSCLEDDECQAIDWNHDPNSTSCRCWLHMSDPGDNLLDNDNVDQWRKYKPCPLD